MILAMNHNLKWPILMLLALVFAAIISRVLWSKPTSPVTSFDECVAAGYPILESYPVQCKTPNGQTFVEDIGNAILKSGLILLETPRPNTVVSNPIFLSGMARGQWFFEASFPVVVLDESGKTIGSGIAKADGDWMTAEFVPFKAEIAFTAPTDSFGKLVLKRDNPSGLPANDDALIVPIKFENSSSTDSKI